MNERYRKIHIVDSHTEGEPTRLIYQGFPGLKGSTVQTKLSELKNKYDDWRKAVILEPRGNAHLVGALLCEPTLSDSSAAVIFFNNTGYLGMCGHGTIGLISSLQYLGYIKPGQHIIETPVGNVTCHLHEDNSVTIQNVPSYRYKKSVPVVVPDIGEVQGDIAWGGNWFFLVSQFLTPISLDNIDRLLYVTTAIKKALKAQGITGQDGAEIDHIELFQPHQKADSQNFVLCPGNAYDRSPCGTGTSAKLACLAADNLLAPNKIWQQASVINSSFEAYYQLASNANEIIPFIKGNAYICADSQLMIDELDPFKWGF